jgi:fatty acid desaturase
MFESLSAGISKQGEKLFHLLLDTGKDDEQGKFAAGVEVVLKILGNFVFLVLLTITIGWLTTLLIAALPDWVTLFFQNLKLGSTVWIYIGMAILYLYLVGP